MGRVRRSIPRSRVPLHRQLRTNPEAVRRWLLVVVLAGCTAVAVGRSIAAGEAARARWGETSPVLVVVAPVAPHDPFDGKLASRRWPVLLVPDGAVADLPPGARAAGTLGVGMPVTQDAVLTPGAPGDDAARIRVAVPLGPGSLTVEEGRRVDLWSTVDPALTGAGEAGRIRTERVAEGAVVVAGSDDRRLVVAVEREEAEAVVEAVAVSTVTPTVVDAG